MHRITKKMRLTFAAVFLVISATVVSDAARPEGSDTSPGNDEEATRPEDHRPVTLEEARGQAKLLHQTIHSTLQIVHRTYYLEDEGLPLPASTMETVFDDLARSRNIKFHWLAVNAQAMSIDHEPQDEFEKQAVKALRSGKTSFGRVEKGVYRHAGAITLFSQCLKCHLPHRTSTDPRTAGLVITIPFQRK
ncbi:MAG: DUF3365 domain-containing protein [Pirellulaceae bacterium]